MPCLLVHWFGHNGSNDMWYLFWWELSRNNTADPNYASTHLALNDLPGWDTTNGVVGFGVIWG
jgi:hypothetical protein